LGGDDGVAKKGDILRLHRQYLPTVTELSELACTTRVVVVVARRKRRRNIWRGEGLFFFLGNHRLFIGTIYGEVLF